tara:strand:+ start:986 stop:1858 length:873 start_codon:yes stop_codon:yes gene_type:complete
MSENEKVNEGAVSPEIQEQIDLAVGNALTSRLGKISNELIMDFDPSLRSKVIRQDDSWIVLGGDRISSKASGRAMIGHSGAHMIDLVVGRDKTTSGQPSFKGDGARVYISQMTDLDNAFGLTAGKVGNIAGHSAVGIKADGVRIVANEGIKLVTMGYGARTSLDKTTTTFTGIDLIAGNDDSDMEPIAKAYKVADAFETVLDIIHGVDALLENFMDAQMSLNRVLATHGHPPFMAPAPAVLAMETIEEIRVQTLAKMPLRGHRMKILQMRLNQLSPFTEGWIGSRYNSTN